MSTLNEEGVMNVKQVACDRLLSSRVETKLQVCLPHPSLLHAITFNLRIELAAAHCLSVMEYGLKQFYLSVLEHGLKQLCMSVPVTNLLLARTKNHMLTWMAVLNYRPYLFA